MKIKMAAIDLDGTLLHDDMSLSDFSKDIIRKAEHRGIRIVLATGRMFDAARPKAEELGLSDTPLICYTGAWIMMSRSGRPIWQGGWDRYFRGRKDSSDSKRKRMAGTYFF